MPGAFPGTESGAGRGENGKDPQGAGGGGIYLSDAVAKELLGGMTEMKKEMKALRQENRELKESQKETKALIRVLAKEIREGGNLGAKGEIPVNEEVAKQVFRLLMKMKSKAKQTKAPLHTVFELMVLKGKTGKETAAHCKCAPSLITARRKTIERKFGKSIETLRAYGSALIELERAVKGFRSRKKKEGAAPAVDSDGGAAEDDLPSEEYGYDEGEDE